MPTRILLVGAGGREHALAWRLGHEPGVNAVVVAPGSDAMEREPRVRRMAGVDPLDGEALVSLARAESVELAVIGPEAPLAAGVADALVAAGIATFGPTAAAARIETSKAFCHEVARAAGVRMARAAAFADREPALAFARQLAGEQGGVVIKADGLAAGKGVTVCDELSAAEAALEAIFSIDRIDREDRDDPYDPDDPDDPDDCGESHRRAAQVVIEERLHGREASLIALCDGRDAIALAPARDHKRLGDADTGPNTGGMGAYSPVPDLPDALAEDLVAKIHRPLLAELARRGSPLRGALYAGLMLTPDGPVLLECNARFGDPEAQVLLPRLAVPLGPLLLAAARGELAGACRQFGITGSLLPVTRAAAVAVVLAAAGYPASPRAGDAISGIDDATAAGAIVFHAGTARGPNGSYHTRGGRVLTVVGEGPDLAAARAAAERAADSIAFQGLQRRHDIAASVPDPVPPAAHPETKPATPTEMAGRTR